MKSFLRIAFVLFFARLSAHADILLPPQFSDNMILQRGAKNHIWGERTSNDSVYYEYDPGLGEKKIVTGSARTRSNSRDFLIELTIEAPHAAARPGTLSIWEGKKASAPAVKRVIQNILVGDVWIISIPRDQGMLMAPQPMSGLRVLAAPQSAALTRVAAADTPGWTEAPAILQMFSYEFARALAASADRKGVPIGIIETTPELIDDDVKARGQGNPALRFIEQIIKTSRIDLNKRISDSNDEIETTLVKMKHRGVVPKRLDPETVEIQGDGAPLRIPARLTYNKYIEYEAILRSDFRADESAAHFLNFEGAIRPPAAPPAPKSPK